MTRSSTSRQTSAAGLTPAGRESAGEGPAINRQLGNFRQLADVGARHNLDTETLLSDLALLTDAVADNSPDLLALASSLNVVLPS